MSWDGNEWSNFSDYVNYVLDSPERHRYLSEQALKQIDDFCSELVPEDSIDDRIREITSEDGNHVHQISVGECVINVNSYRNSAYSVNQSDLEAQPEIEYMDVRTMNSNEIRQVAVGFIDRRPFACRNCRNYCGSAFSGFDATTNKPYVSKLICAIHPKGWDGYVCPDAES